MASRISQKQPNIQASRLCLSRKSPLRPPWALWALQSCFGLAGLPVVPSLGLVWPGPGLPALPATTTTGRLRQPAAAAAVVVTGKAGKISPHQTKPRLATTGKPATAGGIGLNVSMASRAKVPGPGTNGPGPRTKGQRPGTTGPGTRDKGSGPREQSQGPNKGPWSGTKGPGKGPGSEPNHTDDQRLSCRQKPSYRHWRYGG